MEKSCLSCETKKKKIISLNAKLIVQALGSEKNLGDEGDEEGLEGEGRSICAFDFGGGV